MDPLLGRLWHGVLEAIPIGHATSRRAGVSRNPLSNARAPLIRAAALSRPVVVQRGDDLLLPWLDDEDLLFEQQELVAGECG